MAMFACMYFAALRPGEPVSLRKQDCHLPPHGWGRLTLDGSRLPADETALYPQRCTDPAERRRLLHGVNGIRLVPLSSLPWPTACQMTMATTGSPTTSTACARCAPPESSPAPWTAGTSPTPPTPGPVPAHEHARQTVTGFWHRYLTKRLRRRGPADLATRILLPWPTSRRFFFGSSTATRNPTHSAPSAAARLGGGGPTDRQIRR
ncbi:hypothetical protein ACIA8R_34210 [Nonomuraea sp. NPDC051191]|uniref:hypothetical protein n=1 Tax=Nonomuraea sp. NPDC051191 TaxID=3364372 RepID=UPI00379ECAFE